MDINVAEIEEVLLSITDNVSSWEQDNYAVRSLSDSEACAEFAEKRFVVPDVTACGAAYCVAGTVAVRHGYRFAFSPGEESSDRVVRASDVVEGRVTPGAPKLSAREVGAEILGLDALSADRLFAGNNTLFLLWVEAWYATGGRLPLPASLPAAGGQPGVPNLPARVVSAFESMVATRNWASLDRELQRQICSGPLDTLKTRAMSEREK